MDSQQQPLLIGSSTVVVGSYRISAGDDAAPSDDGHSPVAAVVLERDRSGQRPTGKPLDQGLDVDHWETKVTTLPRIHHLAGAVIVQL